MSRKPLLYLGSDIDADHRRVDIARTLSQAQEEISSSDVTNFIIYYSGPKVVLELLLSQDSVQQELILNEGEENHYNVLGATLLIYGSFFASPDPAFLSRYESIIRRLLRIGVDVHAPVLRGHNFQPDDYPCSLNPYSTPLDELFKYTRAADQAKDVADAWLRILSTEGKDVLTYLEKEKALHATRPMFTCPRFCYNYPPRHLVFSLGEAPSVFADRWINPDCSTSLLFQDLKDTNILEEYSIFRYIEWQEYLDSEWKSVWPINYPRWYESLKPSILFETDDATTDRLRQRAQERANRRWHRKARKAARLNGTRTHTSMPGAWSE